MKPMTMRTMVSGVKAGRKAYEETMVLPLYRT
jgi:hypothetical protein